MTRSFNKQQQMQLKQQEAAAMIDHDVVVIEDSPLPPPPPMPMDAPVTRQSSKRKRASVGSVNNTSYPPSSLPSVQPQPKRARQLSPKYTLPPPAPPVRHHPQPQSTLIPKPTALLPPQHLLSIDDQVRDLEVRQIESDLHRLQHARARSKRVEWMVDFGGCLRAKNVGVHVMSDASTAPKKNHQPPSKIDDEDGHYVVTPGQSLTPRYKVMRLLGQGTYGKVVQCYDTTDRRTLAIKVIRSVQKYRDASRIELRVLSTILEHDPLNNFKCIHLHDCFDYKGHICVVTELLGMSVFDFLKSNHFLPFPLKHIQEIGYQLLRSVQCKWTCVDGG